MGRRPEAGVRESGMMPPVLTYPPHRGVQRAHGRSRKKWRSKGDDAVVDVRTYLHTLCCTAVCQLTVGVKKLFGRMGIHTKRRPSYEVKQTSAHGLALRWRGS